MPFLLEGVAGNEKLNQADGIHPNIEGHKIVATNITKVLSPLLALKVSNFNRKEAEAAENASALSLCAFAVNYYLIGLAAV
jgi:phospholipase/lecithinase/hemolysin